MRSNFIEEGVYSIKRTERMSINLVPGIRNDKQSNAIQCNTISMLVPIADVKIFVPKRTTGIK